MKITRTLSDAQYRHAKHFAEVTRIADRLYLDGGSAIDSAFGIFDRERANIERGQKWAEGNLNDNVEAALLCLRYALDGRHILVIRQQTSVVISWLKVGLQVARDLGLRQSEEDCHSGLGLAYARLGETETAIKHHHESLSLARELSDKRGEAISLGNLGSAHENLGDYKRAVVFHEQAFKLIEILEICVAKDQTRAT